MPETMPSAHRARLLTTANINAWFAASLSDPARRVALKRDWMKLLLSEFSATSAERDGLASLTAEDARALQAAIAQWRITAARSSLSVPAKPDPARWSCRRTAVASTPTSRSGSSTAPSAHTSSTGTAAGALAEGRSGLRRSIRRRSCGQHPTRATTVDQPAPTNATAAAGKQLAPTAVPHAMRRNYHSRSTPARAAHRAAEACGLAADRQKS